jgi:hypothetical protein
MAFFVLLGVVLLWAAFPLLFLAQGFKYLGELAVDLATMTLQPGAFSLKVALAIARGPQSLFEELDLGKELGASRIIPRPKPRNRGGKDKTLRDEDD